MAATSRPPHPALLRYCARPPFALERLSVSRGADGQIARIRYVLPRHKVANWVGPSRSRKSTRPGANGVVDLSPFAGRMPVRRSSQTLALAATAHGGRGQGWPCRQMSSRPARRSRAAAAQAPAQVSRGVCTQPQAQAGRHVAGDRERRKAPRGGDRRAWGRRSRHGRLLRCASKAPLARHIAQKPGPRSWRGWGRSFRSSALGCGGDIRLISFITEPGPTRKIPTHVGEPLEPPLLSPARGPPRCVRIFRIGPGPRTGSPQQPEVATSAKARDGFAHRGSDAGASAAAARDRRAGRGTQTVRVRRRHWLPAARTSAHDPARPSWR